LQIETEVFWAQHEDMIGDLTHGTKVNEKSEVNVCVVKRILMDTRQNTGRMKGMERA
jgi:hypothetical protein